MLSAERIPGPSPPSPDAAKTITFWGKKIISCARQQCASFSYITCGLQSATSSLLCCERKKVFSLNTDPDGSQSSSRLFSLLNWDMPTKQRAVKATEPKMNTRGLLNAS